MSEIARPAPQEDRIGLWPLLFGACAAPIVWLGQAMLAYGVTAYVCYPADHPLNRTPAPLFLTLIAFDLVALAICVAGGAVSWWAWRRTRSKNEGGPRHALHTGEGRTRFMALWGIMSSLWFFAAIVFNIIASLTVPPCAG
jgi:uncharacterized membrane protein YeiB